MLRNPHFTFYAGFLSNKRVVGIQINFRNIAHFYSRLLRNIYVE